MFWSETAVRREGGGDVSVVVGVIGAGVEDDEIAGLQSAIVAVIMTPGMVFSRHYNSLVSQFLGALSSADEPEQSGQRPLGHAHFGGTHELEMSLHPDPGRFPHQGHLRRRLDLPQRLDREEAVPNLDTGIPPLQPLDQLQLSGQAAVPGILHHRPPQRPVHFVRVHAVKLFRAMGQTEVPDSRTEVGKKGFQILDRQGRFDPGVPLRVESELGRDPLSPRVVLVERQEESTLPVDAVHHQPGVRCFHACEVVIALKELIPGDR